MRGQRDGGHVVFQIVPSRENDLVGTNDLFFIAAIPIEYRAVPFVHRVRVLRKVKFRIRALGGGKQRQRKGTFARQMRGNVVFGICDQAAAGRMAEDICF